MCIWRAPLSVLLLLHAAGGLQVKYASQAHSCGMYKSQALGLGTCDEKTDKLRHTHIGDIGVVPLHCSAGNGHSLCVLESGTVMSWGYGRHGRLGHGNTFNVHTPKRIPGLIGMKSCSAGGEHSLCVDESGSVVSWGNNRYGQLGQPSGVWSKSETPYHEQEDLKYTPTLIKRLSAVKACSAGHWHSLCVLQNGSVVSFGDDRSIGRLSAEDYYVPTVIPGLTGVDSCSAGYKFSLCVLGDGSVVSFGKNTNPQGLGHFGQGTDPGDLATPRPITGLEGVKSCSAGGFGTYLEGDNDAYLFSICVLHTGKVVSFGSNFEGRLGQGDGATSISTPTLIQGISSSVVVSCSAGGAHTVCLLESGEAVSFGRSSGETGVNYCSMSPLGNELSPSPSPVHTTVPTLISSFERVKGCSAGRFNTLCVMQDR
jgi:alpha-tubulin suppressor-like RCC1 family protein